MRPQRVAIVLPAILTTLAAAQCAPQPSFNTPGIGGTGITAAYRLLETDPDGSGPAAPFTIVSGDFDRAGLLNSPNFAAWDGTRWLPTTLPALPGFYSTGKLHQTSDGRLFNLGDRSEYVLELVNGAWINRTANLIDGPENISNFAASITIAQGHLYVGGFLRIGDRNCFAARWTGTDWQPVGQAWAWPTYGGTLVTLNDDLYMFGAVSGGEFTTPLLIARLDEQDQWVDAIPQRSLNDFDIVLSVIPDGDGVLVSGAITISDNGTFSRIRIGRFSPAGLEPILTSTSILWYIPSVARVNGELLAVVEQNSPQATDYIARVQNNQLIPISDQRFLNGPRFIGVTNQGVFMRPATNDVPGSLSGVCTLANNRLAPLVEGFAGTATDILTWRNQTIMLGRFLNPQGQFLLGPAKRMNGIITPLDARITATQPAHAAAVINDQLAFAADSIYTWDGTTLRDLGSPAPAAHVRQLFAFSNTLLALVSEQPQNLPGSGSLFAYTDEGWLSWNAAQPTERIGRLFLVSGELFTAARAAGVAQQELPARWTGSAWQPLDPTDVNTRVVGVWNNTLVGLRAIDNRDHTFLWRNNAWQPTGAMLSDTATLASREWEGEATLENELIIAAQQIGGGRTIWGFNGQNWRSITRSQLDVTPSIALGTTSEGLVSGSVFNAAPPRPSLLEPITTITALEGDTVQLRIATDPGANVQWTRNWPPLSNGPQPDGSIIEGIDTPVLTIHNARRSATGTYNVTVWLATPYWPCPQFGLLASTSLTILPRPCDSIDFNNNTIFPESQDLIDFFTVLAGADCPTCNDIDFNNNDVFPEEQDIIDFLTALAGGTCP
jgi:hypothetical protein